MHAAPFVNSVLIAAAAPRGESSLSSKGVDIASKIIRWLAEMRKSA
jgi:hypothetical protein